MHWCSPTFIFGQLRHQFIYKDIMYFRKRLLLLLLLFVDFTSQPHTEPLNKTLKVLNVDQVRDYSIASFTYRLTNCMLPSMSKYVYTDLWCAGLVHKTSWLALYSICFKEKNAKDYIISEQNGAKLWNSLCNVIDIDCAISTIKQQLKIFSCHDIFFLSYLYHNFFFLKCYFRLYFLAPF